MRTIDFLRFVAPEAPGCPRAVMMDAVLDAATEFCREGKAWHELMENIPLIDGVREYEADTPIDARVETIEGVWFGPFELRPVSLSRLQDAMPDWQEARSNHPIYYTALLERQTISVYPMPHEPGAQRMSMRATFSPKDDAKTLPDVLASRWRSGLKAGALYRLMRMPGQTWTNETMAAFYERMFHDERTKARIRFEHGDMAGSLAVRPVAFG